jgi:hypothetical protein
MNKILILTVIYILLSSCMQKHKVNDIKIPPRDIGVDTTDGKQYKTIILDEGVPKDVSLSNREMMTLDIVLNRMVEQFNIEREAAFNEWKLRNPRSSDKISNSIIDLRYYKRQYIISLNDKREKIVRVNCFCSHGDSEFWKTNVVEVMDGGKCYFSLVVNLDTNQLIYFQTNGIA